MEKFRVSQIAGPDPDRPNFRFGGDSPGTPPKPWKTFEKPTGGDLSKLEVVCGCSAFDVRPDALLHLFNTNKVMAECPQTVHPLQTRRRS
jgi:hypothetical protein